MKDIPLTAVSTPSGMLWEWLVMPQGLSNAPATFNRCVTHLLRPVRDFAPSYFDDVYIHSRAEGDSTDANTHSATEERAGAQSQEPTPNNDRHRCMLERIAAALRLTTRR